MFITSCSKPENEIFSNTEKENVKTQTSSKFIDKSGAMTCHINGETVINPNGNNAYSIVSQGSQTTYTYYSTPTSNDINWSIVTANPAGSIKINGGITGTGTTVSVKFESDFISGSIKAVGTDASGQSCGPVLKIYKSNSGGDGDGDGDGNTESCDCPNPVIFCEVAESGRLPYWRFRAEGLKNGDELKWTQQYAPFIGNPNTTPVYISGSGGPVTANPIGPLYSGFTIYLEVTRRCTNGTVKKRKAYYTNYYGGHNIDTATKGFINLTTGTIDNNPSTNCLTIPNNGGGDGDFDPNDM